ncbi:acyl-coenzyme A thioesterase THEM4-like isoform X1 [Rana temporaria]|uniref:acyl-coenzyme A thioesterase THEM4-like isoform X1 n=1 Tax=Rana temporaria TaxID=8407 RepID=UPI001AAD1B98|nr:acyl-coenzyme A thioesterase THEM4-like isoform X1 [Rana temporaria]
MLYRILRGHRTSARAQSDRRFSAAPCCAKPEPRDYSLPNPTWSPDTKRLYEELSRDRSWRRLPSYDSHHRAGMSPEVDGKTRLFTRNLDQDGVGFEYCIFYNEAEKRTLCIFQPGPYTEGPKGYTHGGCIAAIIDMTVGTVIEYSSGVSVTANLNINYRNPIPLGATVLIDCRVEKVDGRKVYSSCQVRSHDDAVLHNEATALFITPKSGGLKAKL